MSASSFSLPAEQQQLISTIDSHGTLTLSLRNLPVPEPSDGQVLVRMEAAPINPSDLGVLFGTADMTQATFDTDAAGPRVQAPVPEALRAAVKGRFDQAVPAGNEGAGTVVATGRGAQALLGKTVAALGGGMYCQYRVLRADDCLVLPDGTAAAAAASCFVNPLTALGMVETMRMEGHKALVHTAAASNLGQMLLRICQADDVPLVNVVRRAEQVELLKAQGAQWVCNSSDDDFVEQLTDACAESHATLGFDATGGGRLADRLLTAMERALVRSESGFNRYGSTTHKQVYIYGGLDRGATSLMRGYGTAWGLGGWLLPPFLARIGSERADALKGRVASELETTFKSEYTDQISLAEALTKERLVAYGAQATGQKYLVCPNG
jgi:NADPH2:quinone reductase